jgi:hypothetical protein
MAYNLAMKKFFLTAFAVFGLALSASAADLSGTWTLTGDVEGNAINLKCTFTQGGEKLSGSCTGPGNSPATTGTVTGNKVTLQHTLTKDAVDYLLNYTGTLDDAGSSVQGTIAVAQYSGTWAMKKDTAAPATTTAGFGGTWAFKGDVAGNDVDMKCAFQRDGDKLTGTCAYKTDGDSPTTGTVAGKTVTFQNRVTRDQAYDLTYTGTLDDAGTSMKGDIAVSGVTGEFSGTKAN